MYNGFQTFLVNFLFSVHPSGLEAVRYLTSQGHWDLRVDLRDKVGNSRYATYSNFRLGSEDSFYPLLYDSYSGTAGTLCACKQKGKAAVEG